MEDGGEELGRLSTETVEERRARLITDQPLGSPAGRRVVTILLVMLAILVGVWFGVVPGSSWIGRHSPWSLYALADRIDSANAEMPSGCAGERPERARVDLMASRVEATTVGMTLTADERAMVSGVEHEGAVVSVFCAS